MLSLVLAPDDCGVLSGKARRVTWNLRTFERAVVGSEALVHLNHSDWHTDCTSHRL